MEQLNEVVIKTKDLSKTYNKVDALKSLNIEVQKNSLYGFLGPNGAGKTTTIKLMLGLIKPTSGKGTVFGNDIVTDSIAIRKRVGYLPQDSKFYEYMTAYETLDFAARFFFKGPDKKIKARVEETLELIGLSDKADRPIKTFSGGERQRLGIGQAQVNYPDLLILDEPAASLDPMGRKDVLDILTNLKEFTTIFYCTHILDDVQRTSDTVAILNNGKLIKQGPIEDLLEGSGGIAYSIKVKGDYKVAQERLIILPWVSEVKIIDPNGESVLEIKVSDQDLAEAQLMQILTSVDGLIVKEFKRKTNSLEDVFIDIIEGDKNVKK